MTDLRLSIEWEDPRGARGAELRASWSRLEIAVGDQTITNVRDRATNGFRSGIYLPVYPLAEWMLSNWWALLYEPVSAHRTNGRTFVRRHNLRYAAEGFALPDFELRPVNDHFECRWVKSSNPLQPVEFISSGEAVLDAEQVKQSLSTFVNAVAQRLHEADLTGTFVQEEWEAIQNLDPRERQFCEVAGLLGVDPFDLDDGTTAEIVQVSSALPQSLRTEFFAAADPDQLARQADAVKRWLNRAPPPAKSDLLRKLRRRVSRRASSVPWEVGRESAKDLRRLLAAQDAFPFDLSVLFDGEPLHRTFHEARLTALPFNALVSVDDGERPSFVINRRRPNSQRFAFARAIFDYLYQEQAAPSLVSDAFSARQKQNRAFAAELLAPAHLLEKRVRGGLVTSEDIDTMAAEFRVSPLVVLNQLENNKIARMAAA